MRVISFLLFCVVITSKLGGCLTSSSFYLPDEIIKANSIVTIVMQKLTITLRSEEEGTTNQNPESYRCGRTQAVVLGRGAQPLGNTLFLPPMLFIDQTQSCLRPRGQRKPWCSWPQESAFRLRQGSKRWQVHLEGQMGTIGVTRDVSLLIREVSVCRDQVRQEHPFIFEY